MAKNQEMDYFLAGLEREIDVVASAKITKELHGHTIMLFLDIGCFKGTFSLHNKEGAKLCQVPPRHMCHKNHSKMS